VSCRTRWPTGAEGASFGTPPFPAPTMHGVTRMNRLHILTAIMICLLLASCQRQQQEEKTQVTPVTAPTATPTTKPSATPLPTATATQEPTREAVATVTPMPLFSPRFEAGECPFEAPSDYEITCGTVQVPEDHGDVGNGRYIVLPVVVFHSTARDAAPDPMIYLSGGPGGDSLEAIPYNFETAFAPYLEKRDVVLFDQRGTGFSLPSLACPEYGEMVLQNLERDLSAEEDVALALEAIFACHDRLLAEDVLLDVYNSAQSAADVAMLRQALGFAEWNIYGASYGSRLAQTIMRDHPEGIRSVVLDSTYPIAANLLTATPRNVKRAIDLFFSSCAEDEACGKAYPDLESRFWALVDQYNEEPIRVAVPDVFTGELYNARLRGDALLALLFQSLYSPELTSLFPQLIDTAESGKTELISGYLGTVLANLNFVSLGMMFSVQCHEDVPFTDAGELAEAVAAFPELEELFVNSIATGLLALPVCEEWQSGTAGDLEDQSIASDIPTLIINGELDPITPPEWGRQVMEGLSHAFFFEYPGQGHAPGLSHECPRSMVNAFFEDPSQAPSDACRSEMRLQFATPLVSSEISFAAKYVEEFDLTVSLPDGWLEVAPEYHVSPDRSVELVVKRAPPAEVEQFVALMAPGEIILELESNRLMWVVRQVEIQSTAGSAAGYLGLAPVEEDSFAVLLLTRPEEAESLYEALFLPILRSLRSGS